MAYGMTYDEFWNCSPTAYKHYRECHRLKIEERNQEMWLQGLYIYNAVYVAISNNFSRSQKKYLETPLRITPLTKEEEKTQEAQKKEQFINYLSTLQKNWEKRHGGSNGRQNKN